MPYVKKKKKKKTPIIRNIYNLFLFYIQYMEDFMEQSVISFYRLLKKKDILIEYIQQLEIEKQGHGRER